MSWILSSFLALTFICGSWSEEFRNSPPIPHSDCPAIDDANHAVMLPYPQDCGKYYSCLNGFAYVQQCPNNLHWSTLTYRCDYPQIAKCQTGPNFLTVPVEIVKPPPSALVTSNTNEIIYQLNPNDCSRYFKCQAMACPTNYYWNSLIESCDFPHNARCPYLSPILASSNPSYPNVPSLNPSYPNIPASQPSYPNIPKTSNSLEPFYQLYPNDCSKFYQCQTLICPLNYHWNYRTQQCDQPQIAQCLNQPLLPTLETSSVAVPTAFTAPPTSAVTQPTTSIPESPQTGCVGCENVCDGFLHHYLPHPTDCHKFIQCNGWSFIHTCPDNLFWNAKLNTCDRICVTN